MAEPKYSKRARKDAAALVASAAAAVNASLALKGQMKEVKQADPAEILGWAKRIAQLADDKLAEDVVLLDMREFCSFTDYFLIVTGRNTRQVKGIYDEILIKMKQESRLIARGVAGETEADWIVVDYVDIVVHIMTPEQRTFYRLEELWSDVPRVPVELSERPAVVASDDAGYTDDTDDDY